MDILLNAANAALLLAHDLRRDTEVGLLPPRTADPSAIRASRGFRLKAYQPDIRANAALIRRALVDVSRWRANHPPESSIHRDLRGSARSPWADVCPAEGRRQGHREAALPADATFVLSDNQELLEDEERLLTDRGRSSSALVRSPFTRPRDRPGAE